MFVVKSVNLTNLVVCVPDSNRNIINDLVNQGVGLSVFESAGNNVDKN